MKLVLPTLTLLLFGCSADPDAAGNAAEGASLKARAEDMASRLEELAESARDQSKDAAVAAQNAAEDMAENAQAAAEEAMASDK